MLFIIKRDEATRETIRGVSQESVYIHDLSFTTKSEEEVIEAFERWRELINTRGFRANLKKTKAMVTEKGTNHMIQSI